MSIDRLVEEIRVRGDAELRKELDRQKAAETTVATERDQRIQAANQAARKRAELETARERAQRLASAKLQARRGVFEAKEKQTEASIARVRQLLAEATESDDYAKVLKRMVVYASDTLGKPVRVMGRAEDATLLKKVAGASFDPTPMSIVGGLVAESGAGSRRLNLSFDELLRLREDEVRALLD